MKKVKGFTLAEILITLAIIGVVASLTISSVVVNYKKQTYYTGFMKAYNTLSNAYRLAELENGPIDTWSGVGQNGPYVSNWVNSKAFENYIVPKLKIAYKCSKDANCSQFDFKYKWKTNGIVEANGRHGSADDSFVTQDGTMMTAYSYGQWPDIIVDVNGLKEPNYIGKDVFVFSIVKFNGTNYVVLPHGYFNYHATNQRVEESDLYKSCEQDSIECGGKLLKERKMDYEL